MQFEVLNNTFRDRIKILSDFSKNDRLGLYVRIKSKDDESIDVMIENLVNSCTVNIMVNVEQGGEIAIPAKELFNILNATTDVKTLMFDAQGDELSVTSSDEESQEFEYITRIVQLETNPIKWDVETQFLFDGMLLANLLKKALPFVASGDDRAYLKGVCWKSVEDHLVFQATDGRRACSTFPRKNYNNQDVPDFKQVTVPTQFNIAVIKAFAGVEEFLNVGISNNSITVSGNGITMSSSLIRERFSNIDRIIPSKYTDSFSAQRSELLNAIKKATICCDNKTNRKIKMEVCANSIDISAENEENSMNVTISGHFGGKGTKELYYNHTFLKDLLSVYTSSTITFNLEEVGERRLAVFEDEMATYLIMGIKPR